jgi:hypothetical protein
MSLTFYYVPMSTSSVTEAVLAELDFPCDPCGICEAARDSLVAPEK